MTPTALVVFTDQRQIRALGWLRSGFRHCFVVVRDPDGEWLACDWLVGRMSFRVYGQQTPQTLIERFVAAGHRVAAVPAIRHGRRAWLRPMTCVEVVKQVIGIGTVRPLTPYGLYRELRAAVCGRPVGCKR